MTTETHIRHIAVRHRGRLLDRLDRALISLDKANVRPVPFAVRPDEIATLRRYARALSDYADERAAEVQR